MEELKNYLKENLEDLKDLVRDINSWNGQLENLDYWENNEDFLETFYNGRLDELARAINYGDYNYIDDYIIINAYGNLETITEYEFINLLIDNIDEIVDAAIENIEELNIYNEELKKLINKAKEEAEA